MDNPPLNIKYNLKNYSQRNRQLPQADYYLDRKQPDAVAQNYICKSEEKFEVIDLTDVSDSSKDPKKRGFEKGEMENAAVKDDRAGGTKNIFHFSFNNSNPKMNIACNNENLIDCRKTVSKNCIDIFNGKRSVNLKESSKISNESTSGKRNRQINTERFYRVKPKKL